MEGTCRTTKSKPHNYHVLPKKLIVANTSIPHSCSASFASRLGRRRLGQDRRAVTVTQVHRLLCRLLGVVFRGRGLRASCAFALVSRDSWVHLHCQSARPSDLLAARKLSNACRDCLVTVSSASSSLIRAGPTEAAKLTLGWLDNGSFVTGGPAEADKSTLGCCFTTLNARLRYLALLGDVRAPY
ncbi:hypothetical protein GQ600_19044 [Phytophthora cactorum]|nr:hypothetical protein GQ600_19044 [Phytophthora cactorum]